jgi:hypothetical protein
MGAMNMEDHMLVDALWDAFDGSHMGVTAENIVAKYGFTRQEQDEFAICVTKQRRLPPSMPADSKMRSFRFEVKAGKDVGRVSIPTSILTAKLRWRNWHDSYARPSKKTDRLPRGMPRVSMTVPASC